MMAKFANIQSKIPTWMKSDFFLSVFTFVLWVFSAVFSFYVMAEFQQMILRRAVSGLVGDRWGFQVVRQWSTIFMVGAWIGFVVITGEYHYQHLRSDSSWKVFKWSFLGLLIVLAIALIF